MSEFYRRTITVENAEIRVGEWITVPHDGWHIQCSWCLTEMFKPHLEEICEGIMPRYCPVCGSDNRPEDGDDPSLL